jgi:hypothetical protein
MRRAFEWLQERHGITVTIAHGYNEHGRKWNNSNREHLRCRGNRACDKAVEWASKRTKPAWYGVDARRRQQEQGQDGAVAWSYNDQQLEGDFKEPITEKVYSAWRRHLEKMGTKGRVARTVQAGEVSEKATALAWKVLQDDEWEEVVRGILQRHPATIPGLIKTAEGDKHDRRLAKVLAACKELKTICPRCYDPAQGIEYADSRHHVRWECTSDACVAARGAMEARQAERITRSGPMWSTCPEHAHGASVQGERGALA